MPLQIFLIQLAGWMIGLPLQVLVVSALARGSYRQFPLVFLYATAGIVTTLVEIPSFTESFITGSAAVWRHAARIYWVNECVLQVLILACVINLIDHSATHVPWRRLLRAGLIAGAILIPALSLLIHYQPAPASVGLWMTPWVRDIDVCATLLDLTLWTLLIASRKPDRRLLMISGALGLQFTGEAMGQAIRKLSIPSMGQTISLTGSIVATSADLLCLYLWWQTFRTSEVASTVPTSKA